jgi:hypothetical protein
MVRANEQVTSETRDRLLGDVGGFLVTAGFAMRAMGEQKQNTHVSAVAVCTQISGDLAGSQRDLIAERQYYSATVLGRQVIETTQLVEYLSNHPDRAVFWLTASDDELRSASDLRPAALRRATGSSDAVYSKHCLMGGHPRSVARLLLPGSRWRVGDEAIDLSAEGFDIQADLRALLLADALQHVYDTVRITVEVLDEEVIEAMDSAMSFVDLTTKLVADLTAWRSNDPLAAVALDSQD